MFAKEGGQLLWEEDFAKLLVILTNPSLKFDDHMKMIPWSRATSDIFKGFFGIISGIIDLNI